MDELIDILDSNGTPTGEIVLKSEAHLKGLFHPSIHVWFYTKEGGILIQQRAKNKDTHPLFWDVSVAGHIGAGENIELAAVREVQEEIGVNISADVLHKIGIFKSVHRHSEILIDREFHHTFLCELKVPFENLEKQVSEVEALRLIPLNQFEKEVTNPKLSQKYVPHGEYYQTIISEIRKITNLQ